jgi:hypothetical protein
MVMKPKFKYNIDQFLSIDPKELERQQMETNEALVKEFGISSDPKEYLRNVHSVGDQNDFFDENRASRFRSLLHERTFGKYRQDLNGFLEELRTIKNSMNTGEPAMVPI